MTAVTLYSLLDMEIEAIKRYLSQWQSPTGAQVLQGNSKFKSLFDQLEYGPEARITATEALMHVPEDHSPQYYTTQPHRAFLKNNNTIIFTYEEDMEVAFLNHQRPFEETMGYIEMDLKIGLIRSFTKFYVMDINMAYHGKIGLRPICIPRNQMPFNLNEVYYFDVKFYNDFLSIEAEISQASKIPLPSCQKVLDLSDQECLATIGKRKCIQLKTNVLAYTPLRFSKVVLPNGRVVCCL
ncbi:Retrovirus-related Pol polyprotein from transposon 17.6 [Pyrus ussuriensis x Pyrus communis]|uniref:Retrovirus-related Pol polyprotein from transposon 17.6 n=1 Tax=Pyrus ussuriensis x Pyrus communis TaxID=2448454 RepID=A0A5N5FD01_9ROSA|nr:Retrovirus-related Pol polyprotein from transposon 17.6 [Pyrus ussuriensis x Pyrus communis]